MQVSRSEAKHRLYDAVRYRPRRRAAPARDPRRHRRGPGRAEPAESPGRRRAVGRRPPDSLTVAIGVIGRARLVAEWSAAPWAGATNFFEAGALLRTSDQVAFPDMQYEFLALTRRLVNGRLVPVPGFQYWMDLSRPHSRGQVRLRSADPAAPPSIVFNHLSDRRDLTDLVAGIRLIREIVAQPAWTRYNRGELLPGPSWSSPRPSDRRTAPDGSTARGRSLNGLRRYLDLRARCHARHEASHRADAPP
jgi:choline dehydrogenase-like flavoprotein